jgi:hypothetical protein
MLDVTVDNKLPSVCDNNLRRSRTEITQPILTDGIRVVLVGSDAERMLFSGQGTLLQPGSTSLKLFCPVSLIGGLINLLTNLQS